MLFSSAFYFMGDCTVSQSLSAAALLRRGAPSPTWGHCHTPRGPATGHLWPWCGHRHEWQVCSGPGTETTAVSPSGNHAKHGGHPYPGGRSCLALPCPPKNPILSTGNILTFYPWVRPYLIPQSPTSSPVLGTGDALTFSPRQGSHLIFPPGHRGQF